MEGLHVNNKACGYYYSLDGIIQYLASYDNRQ